MMQDLLEMEDVETHKVGADLNVNFGALVWDTGVRPSYQAVILPGTFCSAVSSDPVSLVLRLALVFFRATAVTSKADKVTCGTCP